MSLTRSLDKWLLVQWYSGGRAVVSAKTLGMSREPKMGTVVTIPGPEGERQPATVIGNSRDRQILEQQISPKVFDEDHDQAGPSKEEEHGDFSASGSDDWEPGNDVASSSDEDDVDDEVEDKKSKSDRYKRAYYNRRTSKVLKPCHRVDAIARIMAHNRNNNGAVKTNHKTKLKKSLNNTNGTSAPDSTKSSKAPTLEKITMILETECINRMEDSFQELFKDLKELKLSLTKLKTNKSDKITQPSPSPMIVKPEPKNDVRIEDQENDQNHDSGDEYTFRSDDSNRSDDNVLITNKYNKVVATNNKKVLAEQNIDTQYLSKHPEWVPIGTGQTLIHKDQYRKVNWKSYTIATRTLLLAVFPRKVLATHSLTGKRSPAFMNKPAKMCLDPKIVSDVIIEITDRFKVKESLVRSIITTKCADECKMYKMRQKNSNRKTLPARNDYDETVESETQQDANQTM